MSDNGYRSIEIQVANYVNATLMVGGSSADEAFIDDEAPHEDQVLARDETRPDDPTRHGSSTPQAYRGACT